MAEAGRSNSTTSSSSSSNVTMTSSSTPVDKLEIALEESKQYAHLFVFSNEKAGMKSVDKDKVNKVIFDMSKGSAYFKEARRHDASTQVKVATMHKKLEACSEQQLTAATLRTREKVSQLKKTFSAERIHCVVDMDMFFVAVEMRDDPSLLCKPVAVGGLGMISTANYVARKYGVRSAMPGFIAIKLCPDLVFVKPNMRKYSEASKAVKAVLRRYDPYLSASLDEAYMDLTPYVDAQLAMKAAATTEKEKTPPSLEERMQFAGQVVERMRREVGEATRLSCSAGIAATQMIAKIASDFNKPNGQHIVSPSLQAMQDFIYPLSIRKIPGIGKVIENVLQGTLGVFTVSDLWNKRAECMYLFSFKQTEWFLKVCLCCTSSRSFNLEFDPFDANSSAGRKSLSTERTFNDEDKEKLLFQTLARLCAELANDCDKHGFVGRCVTIKVKSSKFRVTQKQTKVTCAVPTKRAKMTAQAAEAIVQPHETDSLGQQEQQPPLSGTDILAIAKPLLKSLLPMRLRLMGVKLSDLEFTKKGTGTRSSVKKGALEHAFIKAQKKEEFESGLVISSVHGNDNNSDDRNNAIKRPLAGVVPVKKQFTKKQRSLEQFFTRAADQLKADAEEKLLQLCCPICSKAFGSDNVALNAHLDICLNQPLISDKMSDIGKPEITIQQFLKK